MKKIIITEEMFGALLLKSVFNAIMGDSVYKNLFSGSDLANMLTAFLPEYLEKHGIDGGNINASDFANEFLSSVGETPSGANISGAGGVSPVGINLISRFETGKNFGYKMKQKDLVGYNLGDANGKKTYGYGLLYHPSGEAFMQDVKPVWTQQELERLFVQMVATKARDVKNWMKKNNVKLGQNQFDAMVSACYNFGTSGFLKKDICKAIAANPNNPMIPTIWANLSNSQGERYPGLLKRRATEAELYKKDIKTAK